MTRAGSWLPVFWAAVLCNVIAAGLAVLWLKPRVARLMREQTEDVLIQVKRDVEVNLT